MPVTVGYPQSAEGLLPGRHTDTGMVSSPLGLSLDTTASAGMVLTDRWPCTDGLVVDTGSVCAPVYF